jgi:tetratricopeptide (TPR) repeat protein
MGAWDEAAADYGKLIQLTPMDHWVWYFKACVLAYLGRQQEYSEHCRAMLVQFAETQDFGILERTTKTALLLPDNLGGDMEQLMRRVERVSERDWGSPWVSLLQGIAECRGGRYKEAAALLERCRAVQPDDYFAKVAFVPTDAFLAIARYQLGEMDQARAALDRASAQAHIAFPPVGVGDWSKVNIDHWLMAQIALREAEDLILGQQAPPPKP